ncbi:MAG: CDP-alcohol phosphatidyltransferase family protein [Desulfurococcales archaeon]|nr:CDP-alcohol phosphatidyltransferase family protein [Desulfurococcales archaeon]
MPRGGLGKTTDGPVARLINRRVSALVTRAILRSGLNVTPNQVTAIVFALSILTATLIGMGELVIGGVLVQLCSILDGVDGEIARARGLSSRKGAFIDTMADRYSNMLFLAATAYVSASAASPSLAVLAAVIAISGDLMVSYLHSRAKMDFGVHPALIGPLDSAASRDVRLLLLAILLIVEKPLIALLVVGLLGHLYVVVKMFSLLRLDEKNS